MANATMYYSEERGTWNINLDGEWYAEGTYEQMNAMMENIYQCEAEEQDERYDDYYEYDYQD